MHTTPADAAPMEEPLARLERELLTAYVAGAGYDLHELLNRHDEQARQILKDASMYATARLVAVESRLHYLHELHGEE